jgi:hypothetical protein
MKYKFTTRAYDRARSAFTDAVTTGYDQVLEADSLSDLLHDLDEREDYDAAGRLPSEADRVYQMVERNGEFLLFEFGATEPRYIILTPDAFRARFRVNQYGQTIGEAFTAYLETYNGLERWSDEERSHWIAQCESEGFDLVEAARLYDEERERVHTYPYEE